MECGAEKRPIDMAGDFDLGQVIHADAAQGFLGHLKSARLDDIHRDPDAGGEAEHGGGVLGNVGLIQRDAHGARRCCGSLGSAGDDLWTLQVGYFQLYPAISFAGRIATLRHGVTLLA